MAEKIAGTGFDLELIGHHMNRNENHPTSAEKGYGVTGIYNFDGFYGLTGGYSRLALQYGKGLAAGDSLGKNGWGWANLENTQSWRVVLDSVASMGDLEISTFAFWQKDKNYRWWTEDEMAGDARCGSLVSALIIRSPATLPCSTSWATNTWMTKTTKVNGKGKGGLTKVTVAPTLTFDSGFWASAAALLRHLREVG